MTKKSARMWGVFDGAKLRRVFSIKKSAKRDAEFFDERVRSVTVSWTEPGKETDEKEAKRQ